MKPVRAAVAALAATVLAGCDVPTSVPKIDQQWVLPADNTTIAVDQLLPQGVTVSGTSFAIDVPSFTASQTLGSLCALCVNGAPGPVPAFQGTFEATQSLPTDVSGADVSSGSIAISIHNGLSFDPIAGGGTLTISVQKSADGTVMGQVSLDGSTESLPSGATVQRTMTLSPGAVGSTLSMSAEINSVGGQGSNVNTAAAITVTATPAALMVSSATVDVSNRPVQLSPVSLDVGGLDESIVDHVRDGYIDLNVTNPFGVAMSGQLVINGAEGPISKSLDISGDASSTTSVPYSRDEFSHFLGHDDVSVTGSAVVAAGAGAITVSPGQELELGAKIRLTLEIGG